MTRDNVKHKVLLVVEDKMSLSVDKLKEESSFLQDLSMDSLDSVEIIMGIEDEFGIELSDEEADKLATIKDLIDFVFGKVQ